MTDKYKEMKHKIADMEDWELINFSKKIKKAV